MLKYFFHTFGSQTILESQTLSYGGETWYIIIITKHKNGPKDKGTIK